MTDKVNPILEDVLGLHETSDAPLSGTADQLPGVLERLDNLQHYGVDVSRIVPTKKKALTPEEIAKSLESMRQELGDSAFAEKLSTLPQLAANVREHCEDGFVKDFLIGFAEKNDAAMRKAVHDLVEQNKAEFLDDAEVDGPAN
jgi:hypothetical protein